jgi:tetratricopeptide (TPR) repeat protein
VESVAWISERKDALSAVFFMLTLGAYIRYVRSVSLAAYLLVLLMFALGLMSKPMLVTLPFVLLLLDYWPLGRIRAPGFAKTRGKPMTRSQWAILSRLITEKIPLFALSVVSSVLTRLTQLQSAGSKYQLPFTWRLNNAVVSYMTYIWQMFWPVRLAAFYPHPNDQLAFWQVLLAIAFLIAITLLAIHWRKERPYVFTGWFWYVGMLVPVIGLVQAGEQAHADRYTYLPQIGLYVLIAWGMPDPILSVTHRERNRSRGYALLCAALSATIVILLSWRAFVQTSYWKNSEVLWNHALVVTRDNDVAHNNLGYLFLQRGELDSALAHFETALKIRARTPAAYYNFGGALIENSLAAILAKKGLINEAIIHYDKAISMRPHYGDPYLNLGNLLFQRGRIGDAMAQWQTALGTQPQDASFHALLGDAFLRAGSQKVAIAEYERAVRISAQDPMGRNNLAWLLATSSDASIRDGNRATELAKEAVRLSRGKDPNYLRTLAAAFAEAGHFDEAKETARQALQAAELRGNSSLVNALRDEMALYELDMPYHE